MKENTERKYTEIEEMTVLVNRIINFFDMSDEYGSYQDFEEIKYDLLNLLKAYPESATVVINEIKNIYKDRLLSICEQYEYF